MGIGKEGKEKGERRWKEGRKRTEGRKEGGREERRKRTKNKNLQNGK